MSFENDFIAHLTKFSTSPFLFIGSGFSRRYIGLEDWESLLQKFAKHTKNNYEYYKSSADSNMPFIAFLIAKEFHELWWRDPKFSTSIEENRQYSKDFSSALKIEISNYLRGISTRDIPIALSEEIDLLKRCTIDGIITTNWDILLESIFPDFKVFIGQEELIFSEISAIGEIYKIHGSCTSPNSLILHNQDYENFNQKNPYLAAKLLAIFVEHPIIFLGYSLSDENITSILESIVQCLSNKNIQKLTDRLIFVQWDRDCSETKMATTSRIINNVSLPVINITTSSFLPIFRCVASNKRKFPAKLLRNLKEHIYDLVKRNDPKGKLHVQDINASTNIEDIDVVFGVGLESKTESISSIGYKPITRDDILHDIAFCGNIYKSNEIICETIPRLLKPSKFVPVYKYLSESGFIKDGNIEIPEDIPVEVKQHAERNFDHLYPSKDYIKKKSKHSDMLTLSDLVKKIGPRETLFYYTYLLENQLLTSEELEDFIQHNYGFLNSPTEKTQLIKIICIFDRLKYFKY